jgi:hypothetical protein
VLKLHKTLTKEDDESNDYFTDHDNKRSCDSIFTPENQNAAGEVAFEPSLFTTNIMLHH